MPAVKGNPPKSIAVRHLSERKSCHDMIESDVGIGSADYVTRLISTLASGKRGMS